MTFSDNLSYCVNSLASLFSSPLSATDVVLDPLTTIIRIYSLSFRPQDTKLTFSPFSISFDYPTSPYYIQGARRKYSRKRSSRNDITLLKKSIEQFINSYNLNHKQLRMFAEGSIKGLTKFHKCYSSRPEDPIVHCVEFYIAILQNALANVNVNVSASASASDANRDNDNDDDDCDADEVKRTSTSTSTSDSDSDSDSIFKDIGEAPFKDLWTSSQVNLSCAVMAEIEKQFEANNLSEVNSLLASIDNILQSKDKKLEENYLKTVHPMSPLALAL
jgi:hypothetical protein